MPYIIMGVGQLVSLFCHSSENSVGRSLSFILRLDGIRQNVRLLLSVDCGRIGRLIRSLLIGGEPVVQAVVSTVLGRHGQMRYFALVGNATVVSVEVIERCCRLQVFVLRLDCFLHYLLLCCCSLDTAAS